MRGIGRLDEKITFQEATETQGTFGEVTTSWSDLKTVYAHRLNVSGKESLSNDKEVTTNKVTFLTRFFTLVDIRFDLETSIADASGTYTFIGGAQDTYKLDNRFSIFRDVEQVSETDYDSIWFFYDADQNTNRAVSQERYLNGTSATTGRLFTVEQPNPTHATFGSSVTMNFTKPIINTKNRIKVGTQIFDILSVVRSNIARNDTFTIDCEAVE
jgi:head-tail adaptor